jgi:hypothetical protein
LRFETTPATLVFLDLFLESLELETWQAYGKNTDSSRILDLSCD